MRHSASNHNRVDVRTDSWLYVVVSDGTVAFDGDAKCHAGDLNRFLSDSTVMPFASSHFQACLRQFANFFDERRKRVDAAGELRASALHFFVR